MATDPVWQTCLVQRTKYTACVCGWHEPQPDAKTMKSSNPLELPIINPHAAGIDVGSEKFFVSVGGQEAKVFLTVTTQMQQVCDYLRQQAVRTVAMEATGVYWINLHGALEEAG